MTPALTPLSTEVTDDGQSPSVSELSEYHAPFKRGEQRPRRARVSSGQRKRTQGEFVGTQINHGVRSRLG